MSDARAWLDRALDPGWVERDATLRSADPLGFPGYAPDAAESVVAASGSCGGLAVEAVSFAFAAHGGSMGVVAGEKIARAFERASSRRAAVVVLTATGGARMQEGMASLAQMAKTVLARDAFAASGLPFVAYLRGPTTGGVYASFASLADLVWAEPGATIGFAGPRVVEAFTKQPVPEGSHTAEFTLEHGLIDDVVAADELHDRLLVALDTTMGRDAPAPASRDDANGASSAGAWESVLAARHPDRPTGAGFLRLITPSVVHLRGDRAGSDDAGVVAGFARIGGVRVGVVALDRRAPTAAGYRKAQRLVRTAARLQLPVVTLVDTPGADPSSPNEAAGVAHAIATTFATLLAHPAPTVAVVTGEGGSGGALALAATDVVLVCERAIFSVIGPEAAAAILRRDDVEQVAADLKLTAHDVNALGIADGVVAEPAGGAHTDPAAAARAIAQAIGYALATIDRVKAPKRRQRRWRSAGAAWLHD